MKFRGGTASICLLVVLVGGCGTDDDPVPAISSVASKDVVRGVASATTRQSTETLSLSAVSGDAGFESRGLVELARGRFRLALRHHGEMDAGAPAEVIGTDGEGFESTVAVIDEGLPGPSGPAGPCWFNPHAPVGSFLGTISVEEAARVSGAVVESMAGGEIATAEAGQESGTYLVRLRPSASRPRDDFHKTGRRIWGDRELLRDLGGPILVTVDDDGLVGALELTVDGYRPYETAPDPETIAESTVKVGLGPTDRSLKLDKPQCMALE